ncbi:unnamed protein product [Candida verbasci]|uniref:Calcineurin-like phosphoesterase domain-containing protein n=1 Tax=Candida verbasci TaxID=1227364 RepID=A0A9W4TZ77_9ASCO|nr:unnamed protein product [Candida verbasci]
MNNRIKSLNSILQINKFYYKKFIIIIVTILLILFTSSIYKTSFVSLTLSQTSIDYDNVKNNNVNIDIKTVDKLNDILNYQNNLQQLSENKIITDIRIVKCNDYESQGFLRKLLFPSTFSLSCQKLIPNDYTQLKPQLNYNQYFRYSIEQNSFHAKGNFNILKYLSNTFFNSNNDYYIIYKSDYVQHSKKIIGDISLEKSDDSYELINLQLYKNKILTDPNEFPTTFNYKLYIKSVNLDPNGNNDELLSHSPILRSINVLFGESDLNDARKYHKTIDLKTQDNDQIHPILSLNFMNIQNEKIFKQLTKENYLTKQDHLISLNPITSQNKFKILQLTDLHFGQNLGNCNYESNGNVQCSSDLKTLKFIESSIELENPNLIILNGDLFDLNRVIDFKSVILKILQPILQRNKFFIITFGDEFNQIPDRRKSIYKKTIIEFVSTLPNCLNYVKDLNLHGFTNYNYQIQMNDIHTKISILDSQSQFIDESQITFLYRENNNNNVQNHFKLLFFHNPIPQFRPIGKFKIIGSYNEKHLLNSKINEKFHDDLINLNYNVLSVGHEHENDACILSEKNNNDDEKNNEKKESIWLCYNSITGDSGITKIDKNFIRKVRIFEIDYNSKKLLSWKRNENDLQVFDYQLIHQMV